MSVEITVIENALEPNKSVTHTAPALVPWLIGRFGTWPETAHLYHRVGNLEHDVTPTTLDDARALEGLHGAFVVRVYPASLKSLGREIGHAFGMIPQIFGAEPLALIKTPEQRAREQGGSPNNELGKRSNKARPKERIPYILGKVKSIPDLLVIPYSTYVDHVEYETAYYCVGVGEHGVYEIRDGDTLVEQIEGSSAEVYFPGKAPTGGIGDHEPEFTVGEPIEDDVYVVYQVDAVNGQELQGFSDYTLYGSAFPQNSDDEDGILNRFFDNGDGTGVISVPYTSETDEITDRVAVGDELFVFWPMDHIPAGGVGTAPDLGTPVTSADHEPVEVTGLTVLSIDDTDIGVQLVHITVSIPVEQQAQWALLETYFDDLQDPSHLFPYTGASFPYAQVTPLSHLYVGPFFIDFEHPPGGSVEVVCNFVAPQGLYSDDGVTTRALDIRIQVILTPADASGNPVGEPEAFTGTLEGSATARGQRALTMRCVPVGFGNVTRCIVQARRLTNTPRRWRQIDEVEENYYLGDPDADPPIINVFSGNVADEVRWTHCYSMSRPPNISFGNVTTIHTRTAATSGAVRLRERNLNCIAYRRVTTWNGSAFEGAVAESDLTEDLLFTVMKDFYIGNLPDAQIDFDGIVDALTEVRRKVRSTAQQSTRFSYTLDDSDISFEETLQTICQAAFCVPYRQNQIVKVKPEVAGDDSAILLNHRNIIQRSMRLTTTFGDQTENDSVEVNYVDSEDRALKNVTVPIGGQALRPRQVKVLGLTSELQAYWHAYRSLNKMRYQRGNLSVEALYEAELLLSRDRVLVADQTNRSTQEGDIVGWDSGDSILTTSQPVELEGGRSYTVYLQDADGSVGEYAVLSAPSARELEIDGSPDVIVDTLDGVRTKYILAPDDQPAPRAYLVTSVSPTTPMTLQVEAVNYSHMYYFADSLCTWVDFAQSLNDLSPFRRQLSNSGGSIGSGLWTGASGDYFEAGDPSEDTVAQSYTKIAFVNAGAPHNGGILQTTDNVEEFRFTNDGELIAGHDGDIEVAANYASFFGAEHMVAVTYDSTTDRIALFVDGALVDEGTVAAQSSLSAELRYLEDFAGTCRWIARWERAVSDREVMEFYLRNRSTA